MYFSRKSSLVYQLYHGIRKKSEDKLKQLFNELCNGPKLYSSRIKLMELEYTPLNVSFLKTLVRNFSFS